MSVSFDPIERFPLLVVIIFLLGIYFILYYILKGRSLTKILFSAIAPSSALFVVMLLYIGGYFEKIKDTFFNRIYDEGLLEIYSRQFGFEINEDVLEQAVTITLKFIPAIEFIFSIAGLILFYFIVQTILKDRLFVPTLPSVRYWRLPDWFLWILIIGLALSFLQNNFYLRFLGYNILTICFLSYISQGFGITQSLFLRLNVPVTIRIFFYVFIFLQPFWILFIGFIGILDIWKDFRKMKFQEDR